MASNTLPNLTLNQRSRLISVAPGHSDPRHSSDRALLLSQTSCLGTSDILFMSLLLPRLPSSPCSLHPFLSSTCILLLLQLPRHLLVQCSLISRQNQSLPLLYTLNILLGLDTHGYFSICQPLYCSYLFIHLSQRMDSVFLKGHDKDEHAFVPPVPRRTPDM